MNKEYGSFGEGISGRVGGLVFDAKLLMACSLVLNTNLENIQTEAEQIEASGIPIRDLVDDWAGQKIIELAAAVPIDAKALGLACATAAVANLIHAGLTLREIRREKMNIFKSKDRQFLEKTKRQQAYRRVLTAAAGLGAGYIAYKTGTSLTQTADFAASMAVMTAGIGYMFYSKKKATGKF